jgi:tetratricopeptide (TPR) repeat protein
MNRKQRRAAAKQGQTPGGSGAAAVTKGAIDLLGAGIQNQQAGRLAEAEACYRRVLAVEPDHADALHLLGLVAHQARRSDLAVELIGRAIKRNGQNPIYFSNLGVVLKDQGKLDEAIAACIQAIRFKPDYAEAYSNLGYALSDQGKLDEAIAAYRQAIRFKPDFAEAHSNLGITLRDQGTLDEAVAACREAIRFKPGYAEAFNNCGNALKDLKRLDEALASYDKAVELKPNYAEAFNNRGNALKDLKRLYEALASYDKAVELKPDYAEAFNNRGNALKDLKRLDEALASYDKAVELKPDYAEAFYNRGVAQKELKRFDEALASYDRAIALKPDYADALNNRGNALQELNRLEEALASYDKAVELKPDYAEALSNRAVALQELSRFDEALASYDRAIALKPDFADAYWNQSLCFLLTGRFEQGFRQYEWRKKLDEPVGARSYPQPLWLGKENIMGETLFVYWEQGLGDTIQFCRYVKLVADLGARVILEVPKPLMSLLANLSGVGLLTESDNSLPHFDYQCPLLSLPLAFNTSLSSIPASIPYLKSNVEQSLFWKGKLGEKNKLRVGLAWSGGFRPNQPKLWSVNKRRNIPLAKLAVLKHQDIEFYSLQKGQPAESELSELILQNWDGPHIVDFTDHLNDFSNTAALIDNLDLVISVDTSTAHLAGALGKPVWILNRFDTCWRWLLDRNDSPWYPTAKLYRQEKAGDWDDVVQRVRTDLMRFRASA